MPLCAKGFNVGARFKGNVSLPISETRKLNYQLELPHFFLYKKKIIDILSLQMVFHLNIPPFDYGVDFTLNKKKMY